MSTLKDLKIFVGRTCTCHSERATESGSHPLAKYRDLPAYVLLGDPGSGKTEAFITEAMESGGIYVKARNFATFDPNPELVGKVLFIDGLDEMRANEQDVKTPLDQIRKHLHRLGKPRFRLSCREADWLGDSDATDLDSVSPNGQIIPLHLDPLTEKDILEILQHKKIAINPEEFLDKAYQHGLSELLHNPQTLNMLIEATGNNHWPESRREIYELACQKLVQENSADHRHAKRARALASEQVLDAAGYLCAIHLLSSIAGYALDQSSSTRNYHYWKDVVVDDLRLLEALKTNLFQHDGEELRIPSHRSIAEYLGARYLAKLVNQKGLPIGRLIALLAGEDGGILPDVRGLAAWASVHCLSCRVSLIHRDPLGVVLYGDVCSFPRKDKKLVLEALEQEAKKYPWFRSGEWISEPFGALGTADMADIFEEIITSASRNDADQALLDFVLDAIRHGDPMPALTDRLINIIRDSSFFPFIRKNAICALLNLLPGCKEEVLAIVEDVYQGSIDDPDDELLGLLLRKLYPNTISPTEIFKYFYPPKDSSLIGNYLMFWLHDLPDSTKSADVPCLLDQLSQQKLSAKSFREHQLNRLGGKLLVRGLEEHGDGITNERLYSWLSVGLDEHEHPRLEEEHAQPIRTWIQARPDRYKAIIEHGAKLSLEKEDIQYSMFKCEMRLFGAVPLPDIANWYLKKAAKESHKQLAVYYFNQAVQTIIRQSEHRELSIGAIELLETWLATNSDFWPNFLHYISCPTDSWQRKHAIEEKERNTTNKNSRAVRAAEYRAHLAAIQEGTAKPGFHHNLALAYNGRFIESQGDTPTERLSHFLGNDDELIKAVLSGFKKVIKRSDLPIVDEIIDLELNGRYHYIREACLVGMSEIFLTDPMEILKIEDGILKRMLAFNFTQNFSEEIPWVEYLLNARPALVSDVLATYAKAMINNNKEHINGIYPLSYNPKYSSIAPTVLPELLTALPNRLNKQQLNNQLEPLLKGALHYLETGHIENLIDGKLALNIDPAQKTYWLASGFITNFNKYENQLRRHLGKSKVRRHQLARFFHDRWEWEFPDLAEKSLVFLIEMLGPQYSHHRPKGAHWVSSAMQSGDLVRSFISKLGNIPTQTVASEINKLLTNPTLAKWEFALQSALHSHRITRRKASFRLLSVKDVCRTLANSEPASPADLTALTFDHILDIANKIRNGNTSDYKQYWSYSTGRELDKPKPENDCRDALLSDLQDRLAPFHIDAIPEGVYSENKRSDIRVFFGQTDRFNIPIEIKRNNHRDLWTALHTQLIRKYVRDPGAEGYGIYLVFWFTAKGTTAHPDGRAINSPKELESALKEMLQPDEVGRINVSVIDCALPSS